MMRPSRRVALQDIGNFGVPPLSSATLGKAHFASAHVPAPATITAADRGSLNLPPATLPLLPPTTWVPEERHRNDPQYVTDYVKEIYAHLKKIEQTSLPSSTYMGRQTDITEKMRCILIDWLVDVHMKYQCRPETLYLATNIVDRYLEQENVARERLQLVGLVAMMLAAKYEEIYPPEVASFVNVAANTYTKEDVLRMERQMLVKLGYNLTVPTIHPFLVRALKVSQADQTVCLLANYFAELALLELKALSFLPSCTAAAAVLLARRFRGGCDCWTEELEACTGYSAAALDRCARFLLDAIRRAPRTEKNKGAVYRKYSHPKCGEVAQLVKDKESAVVL